MRQSKQIKILICGILPPPSFGHSMMYAILMQSSFIKAFDINFLDIKFWSYGAHKKITAIKLIKMVGYLFQLIGRIIVFRPRYILFNMSFDKMPFLKDYLYCMIGRLFGCRIILHDMGQYLPELMTNSGKVFQLLVRHLLSQTTSIIVMGEVVKKAYAPFVDERRIEVVPGSVVDSKPITNLRIPFEGKGIQVLYFSYLSVSKGVWTALEAARLVCQQRSDIQFTFGGPFESPALQHEIEDFVRKHDLTNRIRFLGYVDNEQVRTALFRFTDIFMFPSLRDVFGLVLLHAMAEGAPIVASREGAVPETIIDGVNGLLFDKGHPDQLVKHIITLANDEKQRQLMRQANRERYITYYSPESYGQQMINAIESINQKNINACTN